MMQLTLDEVHPGMVVARSVLGGGPGLQLAAGFVLDEAVITRCRKMGMRTLWVKSDDEDELPAGNINDQLSLQAQQAWKDNIDLLEKIGETQDSTLDNLTKFTADPGRFKDIVATERLKGVVDQIIKSILGQEPLVVNLASIRTLDGYLHQHALDTTITATMIAQQLKFTLPDIQEMALGCFLMDLGMIVVPKGFFEKREPPSPREQAALREHPSVGFAILRANSNVPINAAHVAYQHHERLDGTGFPRFLKDENSFPHKSLGDAGGKIHRYAQVAGVADAYNSFISPRPGSQPLTPLQAMRQLISGAGTAFNSHVVNALINLIPVFPTGTRIVVTKSPNPLLVGYIGVVSKANIVDKEKPQIILVLDKFRRKIKPLMVDLAKEKDFSIQFASLTAT